MFLLFNQTIDYADSYSYIIFVQILISRNGSSILVGKTHNTVTRIEEIHDVVIRFGLHVRVTKVTWVCK